MRSAMRIFLIVVMVAGLVATAACNEKNQTEEEADKAQLTKIEAEIDKFIGEAACGEVGDCQIVPFGDKPCGGPWKFKVFSASSVDTTKLLAMVAEYNKLNAAFNETHGWMSDCLAVMPPEIECIDGRCVAIDPMKVKPIE